MAVRESMKHFLQPTYYCSIALIHHHHLKVSTLPLPWRFQNLVAGMFAWRERSKIFSAEKRSLSLIGRYSTGAQLPRQERYGKVRLVYGGGALRPKVTVPSFRALPGSAILSFFLSFASKVTIS